jgi:hypothetical protein
MAVGARQQSYRGQRQLPCQILTVPMPLLLLESIKHVLDRAYKTRGGRRGAVTLLPAVFSSEFLGFDLSKPVCQMVGLSFLVLFLG